MIQMLPLNLFADSQTPSASTTIANMVVTSTKSTSRLTPNVTLQWNGVKNESKVNQTPNHATGFYKFVVTDSLPGSLPMTSTTIQAQGTSTDEANKSYLYNVGDQLNSSTFSNGKLYKVEVVPGHNHYNSEGAAMPQWGGGNQGTGYFFTDFDTKVESKDNELEVTWEHIPGASYQIVYLPADRKTVEEIQMGITSNGTTILPTTDRKDAGYGDSADNQVVVNGVRKVKYTIEDAVPGQIYSVYVVPTGVSNSFIGNYSFERIVKNIERGISGPKVAQASTNIDLKVFEVDPNYVRLEWSLGSWITANRTLLKTTIYKIEEGSTAPSPIGTILNSALNENKDLGYYQYLRPTKSTRFYVEFEIKGLNEKLVTKTEQYIPGQAAVRPLKPQIPKPFGENIDKDSVNLEEYKVLNDNIDKDNPKLIDHTFHVVDKAPLGIQIVWNAPKKKNANNQEVIDYDIKYDIYAVKDRSLLDNETLMPTAEDITFYEDQTEQLILRQDNTTVVGFKTAIAEYTKTDNTKAALNTNSTYFIKVVAKRPYGDTYILSEPTIVSITLDKNGDVFTPPVLAKPPLKLQGTTTTTAVLRWRTLWHEIYVKNASLREKYPLTEESQAKQWNSAVYTGSETEPYIRFKTSQDFTEHILLTSNQLQSVKDIVTQRTTDAAYYVENYMDRQVNLGMDSKYEFKVLNYDEVNKQIEEYNKTASVPLAIQDWIVKEESSSEEGWEYIAPWIPKDSQEVDNDNWLEYTKQGLTPNTRYVLLIRAYKTLDDGTKLTQTFPSYVLATTLSDYESPEETPKTPELSLETKDDTSITVGWLYNGSFNYEIVYGRLSDPEKAKVWNFPISNIPGEDGYVSDGAKATVKITGLMPETTYNIWIRAKQKVGTKISAWSNPVTAKTDALGIPAMPTGLGPAAYQSILEIGKDFQPIAKDYITVEWIKNPNDRDGLEEGGQLERIYSYVIQFADNPEFLDAIAVNTSGDNGGGDTSQYEILSKNMAKFNNLIANRPYYVKVKTIVKLVDKEGGREIVKESEYTNWVRILTKKSSDEYDGGDNDNIVIYPDPITEDYTKDVWTIEIVDTAKIISDIMKQNAYFFTIKAEKYNNRYDAEIRRIKIPKAVIDTLINRNMELRVITSTGTYELPVKALASYTKQYAAKDIVQFDFKRIIDYKIASIIKLYPETLIGGEQLDITVKGKSTTLPIKKLDGYLKVKLKLDAKTEYLYKNIFAYTYNFDRAAWTKETYSIDTLTDTSISYLTSVTGIYSIYEKKDIAPTSLSTYAMRQLASTYDMAALGTIYFQNDAVYRDQFVHLMLGVAQNKSQIDLTAPAYADSLTKAKSAGIYISSSSGPVNEEQAIAGIIKLYELKNGYKIKPSTVRLGGVSRDYQEAVSKAYALGLIEAINPTRPITYGVLCDWILQVTQ